MPQAYSYIRFSTEKQIKGDSLDRQDKLAIAYALKHNLTLDKRSYRDLGISAFKGKNAIEGELGTFLKAVDQGIVTSGSYLLIENIDRLSRDVVTEALVLFMSIINKGIILVTVDKGDIFSKETLNGDWTKLIIAIAEMARSNAESTRKSDMVKSGIATTRAERKPNRNCPSWLQVNEAGTGYIQVSHHVKTVRKIFELSAEGNGVWLIFKYLEKHNIPQLGEASLGWVIPAVARLLHNQAVIGRLVSRANDTVIEDYYPAIIDKNVFFAVQEKMTDRSSKGAGRKGDHIANLFSGLAICGECGGKMRYVKRTVKNAEGNNYAYLHCNAAFYKKECSAVPLNYEPIERELLNDLLLLIGLEFDDLAVTLADPTIAIRAEIADKEAQIERVMDLMEQEGERESKNLLGRLRKREDELKVLKEQLLSVVPARPQKDVLLEAREVFGEHLRLKESKGPELRDVRLKLQNVIKQFVESIRLPTKIEDGYEDVPKKYRIAYTTFRDVWKEHLLRRDYGRIYDSEEQFQECLKLDPPLETWYELPKVGGKIGNTNRTKGKKAPVVS